MLPVFMLAMLISGAANTLLMKSMVIQQVPTGVGEPKAGFDHPFSQTMLMMFGEFLCLIAYYVTTRREELAKAQHVPTGIFATACALDWTATTLVNMAYVFIAASVVQMTRGANVIFTCIFSILFLKRRQYKFHLVGVALVAAGISLVSLSAFLTHNSAAAHGHGGGHVKTVWWGPIIGVSLCVTAQIFQASMHVYEEKVMSQYVLAPLRVVGMEGACGIVLGCMLLLVLNAAGIEDTQEAVYQISHCTPLFLAVIGSVLSIAIYNFSGICVIQNASAVARSTIDVSRTIVIWAVELALGWNYFNYLQLVGFVLLASGTLIYNRLVIVPCLEPPPEALALAHKKDDDDGKKEEP